MAYQSILRRLYEGINLDLLNEFLTSQLNHKHIITIKATLEMRNDLAEEENVLQIGLHSHTHPTIRRM